MNQNANGRLTKLSQKLRREMTKEERKLWYEFLKGLSLTVHRQKVFCQYIADFYIAKARIVIELDGSQHYTEDGRLSDKARDDFFAGKGIKVLRYSDHDVNTNFNGVCADISENIAQMGLRV